MYYQLCYDNFPRVSFMDKFKAPPGWIHDRRTPGEYIIFLIKSGTLYLKEGHTTYTLHGGDMLLLDPDSEHFGTQISDAEYYFIHFPAALLKRTEIEEKNLLELLNKTHTLQEQAPSHAYALYQDVPLLLSKQLHFTDAVSFSKICSLMERASSAVSCRSNQFKTICSCCFLDIMIEISTSFTNQLMQNSQKSFTQTQVQIVNHMLIFLQENYKEKISRHKLEQLFKMTFDHLNRLFKRRTGMTIFAYQKAIRLNHAADLVACGKYKSYEIAEMVGIPDVYYFSKVFKEQFGVSPRNYFRVVD